MRQLFMYIYWCWKFKEIMPWSVRLVDNRELTEEEYNFPSTQEFQDIYLKNLAWWETR